MSLKDDVLNKFEKQKKANNYAYEQGNMATHCEEAKAIEI